VDLAFAALLESRDSPIRCWRAASSTSSTRRTSRARTRPSRRDASGAVNYAKAASLVPAVQSIVSKARLGRGRHEPQRARHHGHAQPHQRGRAVRPRLDIRTPQCPSRRRSSSSTGPISRHGDQVRPGFANAVLQLPGPAPIQSTAAPGNNNVNGVPTGTIRRSSTRRPDDREPRRELALGDRQCQPGGDQPGVEPDLLHRLGTSTSRRSSRRPVADAGRHQAEPTITTLDNRPAQILVGDRVPIRVIDASAGRVPGARRRAPR